MSWRWTKTLIGIIAPFQRTGATKRDGVLVELALVERIRNEPSWTGSFTSASNSFPVRPGRDDCGRIGERSLSNRVHSHPVPANEGGRHASNRSEISITGRRRGRRENTARTRHALGTLRTPVRAEAANVTRESWSENQNGGTLRLDAAPRRAGLAGGPCAGNYERPLFSVRSKGGSVLRV